MGQLVIEMEEVLIHCAISRKEKASQISRGCEVDILRGREGGSQEASQESDLLAK